MAKTAVLTSVTSVLGDGNSLQFLANNSANLNAPPPISFTLANGTSTIATPSSTIFSYSLLSLVPPPNSTVAKTIKGISGDTGLSGWTNQPITVPAATGGTFVIVSNGVEVIQMICT